MEGIFGKGGSRVQLDAPTSNYITSYVYNDLNQLAYIVTPGAVRGLVKRGSFSFNESGSDPIFTKHIYAYHYDSVGRVVEKKIPGKGWQYLVYNRQNQVVLSQDSNMRAKGQWSYIKYDGMSRIIQTGIYTNTSLKSRRSLQGACDQNAILWETWQPGTGYTNLAFPQQSTTSHGTVPLAVYTKSYYDDYTFSEASAKPFRVTALNGSYSARTQGLLTGESVYVLGTSSQFLTTVNYYDSENMLIQQQSDNHLGQVDTVSNQFNFIGELIKRRHNSAIGATSGITLQERYTYDQVGRPIDTWESYQNTQEVLVSHLEYSEAGKVVTKRLHSTNYTGSVSNGPQTITENTTLTAGKTDVAGLSVLLTPGFLFTATPGNTYVAGIASGTFLQNIEYRYTIRGQLRTINSPTLTTDGGITQSDSTSLFGEQVNYSETTGLAGTPQYGGNITSVSWRNRIEVSGQPGVVGGSQGFTLGYDAVDRQMTSKYYQFSGNTWTASATDAFSENIPKYDEMGNIDSLVRKDKAGTAINNLSYQYKLSGNKLAGVTDKGTEAFTSLYSYDGNGNMVSDSKKGITVTYNYLDLPDTIKQGNSRLVYTYSAGGIKLYKQLITSGAVVSQRHYVGGVEATATSSFSVDGKIEYAAMPEGKLISTGGGTYQYEYFLQDHLGNNRVNFRVNANGTLGLSEVQNYYPLGKDMGDATMNYTASPQNLYKYSNKEIQQELSLMDYDFGARHYDPRIGRWQGIDALAEKYIESSPYNYVANSPVNNYDPDGMVTKPQLQTPSEGYNFDVFGSDPWGAGAGIASAVLNAVESIHGPSGLAKIDSKDAPKMSINAQTVGQGDGGGGEKGKSKNNTLKQATISAYNPNNHYRPGSFDAWVQQSQIYRLDPVSFGGGDLGYGLVPGIYTGFEEAPQIVIPEILISKLRYAIWGPEIYIAVNGETSATKFGREMHRIYKYGLNDEISTFKEYRKINGIIPDFVDMKTQTIFELKPNNPRAIKLGEAQLEKYRKAFVGKYGGVWKKVLDLY